jgi:hypothetical protein
MDVNPYHSWNTTPVRALLPSVEDGLDDVERGLVRALSSAGAATPAGRWQKATSVLARVVHAPWPEGEDLDRLRSWRDGSDQELRAAAQVMLELKSIEHEIDGSGRSWRTLTDPVVEAYCRLADLGLGFRARYPLAQLNGNWSTIQGDPPADHFYTECRLSAWGAVAAEARGLNLLVNGYVARERPQRVRFVPHNLGEVVDALCQHLDGHRADAPLPDLPTGGLIVGSTDWETLHSRGRGSLRVRARTHLHDDGARRAIVVTELPYLVDGEEVIVQSSRALRDGVLTGVDDILAGQPQAHLEVMLSPGADPSAVLDSLFAHTSLEMEIEVESLAVMDGVARVVTEAELVKWTARGLLESVRSKAPASAPPDLADAAKARLLTLAEAHGDQRRTSVLP